VPDKLRHILFVYREDVGQLCAEYSHVVLMQIVCYSVLEIHNMFGKEENLFESARS
jgi:hypothetical protein